MDVDWNMEQLEALADWVGLHHEWESTRDEKPPWMREPCPADANRRVEGEGGR